MIIHITPKLYAPPGIRAAIALVDVKVEELGLHLLGGTDVVAGRPYPNKCFLVARRLTGMKHFSGLVLRTEVFVPSFTVVTRWAINAERILTHKVIYDVLDREYDAVTDDMLLWFPMSCETYGTWPTRWPDCYSGSNPSSTQPRMDLVGPALGGTPTRASCRDTDADDGVLIRREEPFSLHTVEPARLQAPLAVQRRVPPLWCCFDAAA